MCLNRHLPGIESIEEHAHPHGQLLLYMGGAGSQKIAGRSHLVRRGTLFYIPARTCHAFLAGPGRRPLCLAIDLNAGGASEVAVACLNDVERNQVRHFLSKLPRWKTGNETVEPCEAAAVLQVTDVLFRALGFLRRQREPNGLKSVLHAVNRKLNEPEAFEQPLAVFAAGLGYHTDYLNRLLKGTCGLTLGALRANIRVQKAKKLLAGPGQIADVAMDVGFGDPSYFSRWFRQQTGKTPREWREDETIRAGSRLQNSEAGKKRR